MLANRTKDQSASPDQSGARTSKNAGVSEKYEDRHERNVRAKGESFSVVEDRSRNERTKQFQAKQATKSLVQQASGNKRAADELSRTGEHSNVWRKKAEHFERVAMEAQKELQQAHQKIETLVKQHKEMEMLAETRRLELHAAQTYLNEADMASESDVVNAINGLNAEIFQAVKRIADSFRATNPQVRDPEAEKEAERAIGPSMVQVLRSTFNHQDDTILFEAALQAAMVCFVGRVISVWNLAQWEDSTLFDTHVKVFHSESHGVAGRWRALTRKHSPRQATDGRYWEDVFVEGLSHFLSSIIVVAGGNLDVSRPNPENLKVIVCAALQLRKMIGEDIVGSEYIVRFGVPGEAFTPESMDDWCAADGKAPEGKHSVLCPSALGLQRFEKKSRNCGGYCPRSFRAKTKGRLGGFRNWARFGG
ncbi:uncharacterized protein LAESUDRAFT_750659 [Laetiporus sulphureus 93-53]|uniref:Uncharacterized protein n=1 Tax=Laetiporus sulphureus 93-53 TaxID=1314785 RepID=A0A165DRN1_9APHY|nr:uncharacterized protein LAESUDRAFT_750659 [Laetiporus sulphureus 93-53]KZT05484.1 hypothetical protein LAESUDRAFT_750659 [Laetiporus sulphureus 93-53]